MGLALYVWTARIHSPFSRTIIFIQDEGEIFNPQKFIAKMFIFRESVWHKLLFENKHGLLATKHGLLATLLSERDSLKILSISIRGKERDWLTSAIWELLLHKQVPIWMHKLDPKRFNYEK